jgi:predicted nucleic-acid-binding protein
VGGQTVRVTADTNVLVRAITGDDAKQSKVAQAELAKAESIAISTATLCELVWVLSQGYGVAAAEIERAIRLLINSANVAMNRPAAEAGLSILSAGGDFADGVIAAEGRSLGAEVFVSFDQQAVRLLAAQGEQARLLR